jgi:DNA-binding MarR family transcriptional regulator
MNFQNVKRDLVILLTLKGRGKITLSDLSDILGLVYQNVRYILEKWIDEGLIQKDEIEGRQLGEDKYRYFLAEEGEKELKALADKFSGIYTLEKKEVAAPPAETNSRDEGLTLEIAEELVLELPEWLVDLGIEVTNKQYKELQGTVKEFLKKYGITP